MSKTYRLRSFHLKTYSVSVVYKQEKKKKKNLIPRGCYTSYMAIMKFHERNNRYAQTKYAKKYYSRRLCR